ncbi:MAG: tetratricopeptide repeat protein [Nitrospirae bacterium]|nr:tetratricopeptide repeat protein [Nitrospirota bacterium]
MKTFRWFVVASMVSFTLTACYGGPSTPQIPSLMSPAGMTNTSAADKNNEGVDHLVQGHYGISETFFRDAIAAKHNFAEAHFNLGVALDGMGKHEDAKAAFQQAREFGASNPKIADQEILKKHLGM